MTDLEQDISSSEESQQEVGEIKPDSKVGLSLGFCVRDILDGKVKEAEVKEIITSSRAHTPEEWAEVIDMYKETDWTNDPDEGSAIAMRLLSAGKVQHAEGDRVQNIGAGHWVDTENTDSTEK